MRGRFICQISETLLCNVTLSSLIQFRTNPYIKDNGLPCATTACEGMMTKAKSWEVTEEFWKRVEPLMPIRQRLSDQRYTRKSGGGRKPKAPRLVFEAIVFVLR